MPLQIDTRQTEAKKNKLISYLITPPNEPAELLKWTVGTGSNVEVM